MFTNFLRKFHNSKVFWSAETSLLAKLRKKTGYTFSNCKKALDMHNNDLQQAEKWLNQQAQTLGWAKATKVAGRSTKQGLVAVKFDISHAALVEVNCETDFVARNEKFQSMVDEVTNACFKFSHSGLQAKGPVTKMCLDSEQLSALHGKNGKTLAEDLVLMIGTIGENALLRRAECWKASPGLHLVGYAHPPTENALGLMAGKFGGILAYTCDQLTDDVAEAGLNICQHIVGMNPQKIGEEEKDKPAVDIDDENVLIYQELLSDPSITVGELLKENKMKIVDFIRYQCGEESNAEDQIQPMDNIQTCQ